MSSARWSGCGAARVALLAGTRGAAVRAIVAYYPVTDVARWKITTSHPMAADVLLIHGDADTRVPTEQSILMYEALTAAGRPVTLTLIPGAQHGFTPSHDAIAQPAADRFLADRLQ